MATVNRARSAVLEVYAAAYDRFCEEEQILIAEGRYLEAQRAHEMAARIIRSYRAEMDNPKPETDYRVTYYDDHPHHTPIPGCERCGRVL